MLNPIITRGGLTAMRETLSVAGQLSYQKSFPEKGIFLVAVAEGSLKILGLQSIEPVVKGQDPVQDNPLNFPAKAFSGEGEISSFVSLAHHGKGIGTSLCAASFQAARAQGYQKISAYIRADNPAALSFYRKNGFQTVEHLKGALRVKGGSVDQIWAVKEL